MPQAVLSSVLGFVDFEWSHCLKITVIDSPLDFILDLSVEDGESVFVIEGKD